MAGLTIIEVKKVGEESGFCTEYFQSVKTKRFFARVEEVKGVFNWFSTSENYGEPDCPIKACIKFVEVLE